MATISTEITHQSPTSAGAAGSPAPQPAPAQPVTLSLPHPAPAALEVHNLGKCYHIYDKPIDRLKQGLFRGRRRYFREFWALRGVTLALRRGESLGIIGRNGSGKSTLLQMIAGTLAPTEGRVAVHGSVAALLELGAGFNRDFTGRENVFLAGAIRGLSRADIEALYPGIVEFADIGDFIDQPVKTYSSGMYVRLAFAVSAHVRPDILVVDEALAVGDIFFQQKCHRFMSESLHASTRILVSHDLRSISNHCERVVVLDRGRMAFEGPAREAIAFYTSLVHREHFGAASPTTSQGAIAGPNRSGTAPDIPWVHLDNGAKPGVLIIERVALTDPAGRTVAVLQPGDRFSCHFLVRAAQPIDRLIFGVTIQDRFGNAVCGDNTISLPDGPVSFPAPGRYAVRLDYRWPELQPGDYTATFGVGRGEHALHHDILSWAHNAVAIRAISPSRPVHGLFNNPLLAMEVSPVERP